MSDHMIDVKTLSNEQLQAEKRIAFSKANDILGASGRVDEARFEEAKIHLAATDQIEAELKHRRDMDGARAKAQGGIASLFANPAAIPFGDDPAASGGNKGRAYSPGQAVVQADLYQAALKSGAFNTIQNVPNIAVDMALGSMLRQGRKSAAGAGGEKGLLYSFASGGGAFVIPQYDSGYEQLARPGPDILDLLTVQPTSSDTIYWVRQDTRSTAATAVSQASVTTGTTGTKPESALAFTRQSTPVETIAVWIAATNQQLADAPELQSIIDNELTYDLLLQLDAQILSGSGTSPNLTGILNAGIKSVAHASTFSNIADTIYRGMVVIATGNEPNPTGIVINPLDWEEIRLLRESGAGATASGTYIMGAPMESGPMQLWGLPVVISNRMTSGTALVGDFRGSAKLHVREDSSVKIGLANDDFIRNMVRILAEMRAALTVRRPAAFAKVTGL